MSHGQHCVLGSTDAEHERLTRQAAILESHTERIEKTCEVLGTCPATVMPHWAARLCQHKQMSPA